MSKYTELRNSKPQINIRNNPKEVIFTLVGCMCDDISYLKLRGV